MTQEIWKDIPGYENLYQASTTGKIRSLDRTKVYRDSFVNIKGKILAPCGIGGYLRVCLYNGIKKKTFLVHQLIAKTFISKPSEKSKVNHIDFNKANCSLNNLEWCTQSENVSHSVKHGRHQRGERHAHAKIKEVDVILIRSKYNSGNYLQRELAVEYNLSECYISHIVHKRVWKHV